MSKVIIIVESESTSVEQLEDICNDATNHAEDIWPDDAKIRIASEANTSD